MSDQSGESLSTDRREYFLVPVALTFITYAGASASMVFLAIYFSTENSPFIPGIIVPLFIGAYALYAALDLSAERTWTARFFSDHAKYGRLSTPNRLEYSQIERIERSLVRPPLRGQRTRILIYVKGESQPIVIPMNLKNYFLKTDLFSWLQERTGTSGTVPS